MGGKSGQALAHDVGDQVEFIVGEKERAFVDRRSPNPRRVDNQAVKDERRTAAAPRRSGMERRFFATAAKLENIAQGQMTWQALHELAGGASKWAADLTSTINSQGQMTWQALHELAGEASKWAAELTSAINSLKARPPEYLYELASGAEKWAAALIEAVNSLKPAAQPAQGTGKPTQQGAAALHDVLSARSGQIGEDAAPYLQRWKNSSTAPAGIELHGDVPNDPDSGEVIEGLYAVVNDLNGDPVENGVQVTVAVTAGRGSIRDTAGNDVEVLETKTQKVNVKDAAGREFYVAGVVLIEQWELGPKPGANALTVTVGSLSKTFTATTTRV